MKDDLFEIGITSNDRSHYDGSNAQDDELWAKPCYKRVVECVRRRIYPCVVYLADGELLIAPVAHADSLNTKCIVGVYDNQATEEMIYEDLQAL
jgi:hypothetical protein